jgi:exodeoxyribonuclease III
MPEPLAVASWNVNSLRVRLPQVLDYLRANPVDVIGLQETKLTDDLFPRADFEAQGYHVAFCGQKTYNGVALLSRQPLDAVCIELAGFDDPQRRVIAATSGGVRYLNVYVPNGQSVGSEKYDYKLRFLAALRDHLEDELARFPKLVVMGDFNIAPDDRDVHDPAAWAGQVLCSPPEREALGRLLALGLADSFRLFDQPPATFSWWDYRVAGFRRNLGLRIDLLLASRALVPDCVAAGVHVEPRRNERPSDHAPVYGHFAAAAAAPAVS